MEIVTTPGCGDVSPLNRVCVQHVERRELDGFTIHWHTDFVFNDAGRLVGQSMWRNGPTIRPNVCASNKL